jgi:hypothetical protein
MVVCFDNVVLTGDVLSALCDESKKALTSRRSASNLSPLPSDNSIATATGETHSESSNSATGSVATTSHKPDHKPTTHIPYLNSKLTHYLKEALGGNCRTAMITTLHSTHDSVAATALMYAEWASKIRHTVHVNHVRTADEHWLVESDPEAARLK